MNRITVSAVTMMIVSMMLGACSAGEKQRPPEGRCFTNPDCPEGFRCKNTYCEDIYFPRNEIKPY
jgi:Cys-rich repeat protein